MTCEDQLTHADYVALWAALFIMMGLALLTVLMSMTWFEYVEDAAERLWAWFRGQCSKKEKE